MKTTDFAIMLVFRFLLIIVTCYMVLNYSSWCWLLLLMTPFIDSEKKSGDD